MELLKRLVIEEDGQGWSSTRRFGGPGVLGCNQEHQCWAVSWPAAGARLRRRCAGCVYVHFIRKLLMQLQRVR